MALKNKNLIIKNTIQNDLHLPLFLLIRLSYALQGLWFSAPLPSKAPPTLLETCANLLQNNI